jgi:hydrogenase maturation factor
VKDKALEFESRFSLPPNSLGYCGRGSAAFKFRECIINGNCKGVKEEVSKFIVLNPYLQFLAKISGNDKFSYKVIEGYWLGNLLLKKAKLGDYPMLLNLFKKQGVPDFFVKELSEKVPSKLIPSHLFHVLHVGVGKASGAVPFNLDSINNCMIRWGKVEKIIGKSAIVRLNSLMKKNDKYNLTVIKETVPYDAKITGSLKIGDIVAVHWQMVIKNLTKQEIKKLEYWTKEVIKENY